MAKTIKFNLICDNASIRTVEDLQNNFSVEDVLGYYHNGLLQKWLEVRGYMEALKKVKDIKATSDMEIVKQLIGIFNIETDMRKVEEAIYMMVYLEDEKEVLREYKKDKSDRDTIIKAYQDGYSKLIHVLYDVTDDSAKIKATIREIVEKYDWALRLHHRRLFWQLVKKSPLAIMCLLMNEGTRKFYLPMEITIKNEDGTERSVTDTEQNSDKKEMYTEIIRMLSREEVHKALEKDIKTYAGQTNGYWNDLEPKGRQFMIISMYDGDYIRPLGAMGEEYNYEAVKNKFLILDGIDFKSNSSDHTLLYMEV